MMRELPEVVAAQEPEDLSAESFAEFAYSSERDLAGTAQIAASRATMALERLQYPEGYWVGDLTADSTLQADYILLQMWLYPAEPDGSWKPPTMGRGIRKAVRFPSGRAARRWGLEYF